MWYSRTQCITAEAVAFSRITWHDSPWENTLEWLCIFSRRCCTFTLKTNHTKSNKKLSVNPGNAPNRWATVSLRFTRQITQMEMLALIKVLSCMCAYMYWPHGWSRLSDMGHRNTIRAQWSVLQWGNWKTLRINEPVCLIWILSADRT